MEIVLVDLAEHQQFSRSQRNVAKLRLFSLILHVCSTQWPEWLLGGGMCLQGVICFESIMDAAESKGYVHHGAPVICKPSFKVHAKSVCLSVQKCAAQRRTLLTM